MDEPHPPPPGVAPESDTLGLKHIGIALQDLPFPMTRRELLDRAGAWRMPVTGAQFVPLAEYLEGTRRRSYRNARAVVKDIGHAHPELR